MSAKRNRFSGKPCSFCGGLSQAESIDHVPGRAFFRKALRPKGLEFPACHECNSRTRISEIAVSVFSRLGLRDETPEEKEFIINGFRSVLNNDKACFDELVGTATDNIPGLDIGNNHAMIIGPKSEYHLINFGVKLAIAFFYEAFKEPAPLDSKIRVEWRNEFDDQVRGPLNLDMFGDYKTLQMGKFTVLDQMTYRMIKIESPRACAAEIKFTDRLTYIVMCGDSSSPINQDLLLSDWLRNGMRKPNSAA
jgi:hypothetical protein